MLTHTQHCKRLVLFWRKLRVSNKPAMAIRPSPWEMLTAFRKQIWRFLSCYLCYLVCGLMMRKHLHTKKNSTMPALVLVLASSKRSFKSRLKRSKKSKRSLYSPKRKPSSKLVQICLKNVTTSFQKSLSSSILKQMTLTFDEIRV
jgi:hypothetical protein